MGCSFSISQTCIFAPQSGMYDPVGAAFGEVDCRVADDTVRRPDLAIFLSARLQQIDLKKIPAPFARI